jgi:hypothetical protein
VFVPESPGSAKGTIANEVSPLRQHKGQLVAHIATCLLQHLKDPTWPVRGQKDCKDSAVGSRPA